MDNGGIENTHLRSRSKGIPRKSQKRQFQWFEKIWDPKATLWTRVNIKFITSINV